MDVPEIRELCNFPHFFTCHSSSLCLADNGSLCDVLFQHKECSLHRKRGRGKRVHPIRGKSLQNKLKRIEIYQRCTFHDVLLFVQQQFRQATYYCKLTVHFCRWKTQTLSMDWSLPIAMSTPSEICRGSEKRWLYNYVGRCVLVIACTVWLLVKRLIRRF